MKRNKAPMTRSAKTFALAGLALAWFALGVGEARAQLASGKGPIDVTADQLEMIDAQHLAIWRGNVEAVQNGNRLVSDVLNVYFTGKPAPGTPSTTTAAAPNAPGSAGADWGDVERLVADGHVFYVSADQTARGEHAVYEAEPDIITMTGDVVLVQGKNVTKGDKLVIDVKTNHAVLTSTAQGRNRPERVRGVFYNANTASSSTAAATPASGAPGRAPAATAAKP